MVQEKLRAVFYARVSTEEERQLNALDKQVAECKDAVLQKGWKLVDQYVDEGKSGTQIKRRDEYKRLFEDLENDKFDIVVIKSQDRLQRNTLDWYIWIDRLTTHGKRLYMYLEDTFYSPDNALISGIKAILAEEYSRELSKKINNSYKRRIEAAKNGEKISIVNNSRSLGYDKVNGELVINEKEAEVVRMIFNMYASGEGLRAISNTLYDMGYRNRSGNEIDPTTISRMLSSEKYKGVYVINQRHYDFDTKKTVLNPKSEWVHIPGAVPAIVEPELWDRVQEIKGSKVQSIKNEKRGRNCGKSIFSGKIYCAKCGAKYWRSLENGYVKFKCSSYSKYGKIPGKGCDNKSFSENALYSILQSLSEQIVEVNTAEVRKSLLNWLESLRERLRASQGDDTIKEEIRKQTARKEKLTDAYMDGIISKEDYSKRYKELEKTLEDLKDKLLTLEVNEDLQSIEEVIQNIDKEMEEYLQTQSFNESRVEFLNQHLTKVTVNKDSFLLEFDLIGGAILTGKDFYLFVDNPRKNRNIRHLRTRTTGSRNQHQLLILHDRKQPVIKIRNRRNILQCKQLGKIQNAAATNRNHTLRILRHILPDCLSHHIRRLALTIILTEDHITAKPQRLKKFLKQSLIGKKQIPFTKFKFLRKLPAIIKTVNRRSDHQFLHSFSSCQPRISQKLFL